MTFFAGCKKEDDKTGFRWQQKTWLTSFNAMRIFFSLRKSQKKLISFLTRYDETFLYVLPKHCNVIEFANEFRFCETDF